MFLSKFPVRRSLECKKTTNQVSTYHSAAEVRPLYETQCLRAIPYLLGEKVIYEFFECLSCSPHYFIIVEST